MSTYSGIPSDPGAALKLLRIILAQELGDEGRAMRLASRVMWRKINRSAPWQITSEEIHRLVTDVEAVERETSGIRSRVASERPPVEHDGGLGAGGGQIVWDRDGGLR